MERGAFIVVEGPDKAGKDTQIDLLARNFIMAGEDVITIDFPCYDTISGQAIREILDSNHTLDAFENPYEVQALYMINRYEQQARIENALMQGKVVICNRYTYSSVVYGAIAGIDVEWAINAQHSLVKPDITILLDIDMATYRERCRNYDSLDAFEASPTIEKAMELYRTFAESEGWLILNGNREAEELGETVFTNVKLILEELEA